MPSAPPAAPKYVMKVMLKFWLKFMGVEFHAEPAWLFVAVVRVTPLPPTKALPFVIHEAHTGGMVVGVKVGVLVGVRVGVDGIGIICMPFTMALSAPAGPNWITIWPAALGEMFE
jgi:hypothetical protein